MGWGERRGLWVTPGQEPWVSVLARERANAAVLVGLAAVWRLWVGRRLRRRLAELQDAASHGEAT